MRLVGTRGLVALVALGTLASCFEADPQQSARAVCTAYCECVVTAGQVEMCITDDCLPILPPVSDECLDCVTANSNSCTSLDAQCTDICLDNSQP